MNRRIATLILAFGGMISSFLYAEGRQVIPFNEGWKFKKAPVQQELLVNMAAWEKGWKEVTLPHTWNNIDMQTTPNNFYQGPAYYQKTYDCPADLKGKRVYLRFEGVGACAWVYVNNTLATTHKGGYSAFACEITDLLKPGAKNGIVVKADNASRPDVIPVNHQLFGVYGGIYRPVSLIVTEDCHICLTDYASPGVYITQKQVSKQSADVHIRVKLDNGTLYAVPLTLENKHHDEDLSFIMDIGATTVRFAHYQQSDYLYSRCDSLGLIIWAEIPFVNRVTGEEAENARNQLRELIRQNLNHPSIYVWGLHNEVYQPHIYTRELTQSLHDLAKAEDPDRFTASVNGYGHMEHPVNLWADIQGMNRYFGWYEKTLQDIEPWVEGLETNYPETKLMLTEYGADANIHHQSEYLGDALNWGKEFYPETFQTKTHEYHWSVIARHPYILASYLWNMFDFACPMWERGGVACRNMKGLVTFDRKIKKDAYYWYKANWSQEPVLYLTQRRNVDREKKVTSITVYSNIGTPRVFLNGKELSGIQQGYTEVHYRIDPVTLADGENIVRAQVEKDGKVYEDEIRWMYTGEKRREADASYEKEEHAGF